MAALLPFGRPAEYSTPSGIGAAGYKRPHLREGVKSLFYGKPLENGVCIDSAFGEAEKD